MSFGLGQAKMRSRGNQPHCKLFFEIPKQFMWVFLNVDKSNNNLLKRNINIEGGDSIFAGFLEIQGGLLTLCVN